MNVLLIPTNKGTRTVQLQNIIRVEANSNYCKIYFDNEYPLTVAKVLQWFEDKLPENFFCRIHRSHLVHRKFISTVSTDYQLTLQNGEKFQISKRKKNVWSKMVV